MRKFVLLAFLILAMTSCEKNTNPMSNTSWESRNATGLWSYSQYSEGDFAEILKFEEDQVHDVITRDGHTYRDKGWYKYRFEPADDGRDYIYITTNDKEVVCTVYGNTLYRSLDIFYKQ